MLVCANVTAQNPMSPGAKPTSHGAPCGIFNPCYRRERADDPDLAGLAGGWQDAASP
jgi:hypothetical protein